MCVNAQRIAREDDKVGVLADLERTDAFVEVEHLGVCHRQGVESFFTRHTRTDGNTAAAKEPTRIGDAVIGMKTGQCARLFEHRGVDGVNIHRFELAARRIDKDDRRGHLGLGDLVGDLPRLADVLEHEAEPELFLQTEDSHDVVRPVRVKVDHAFAVESLDQSLHREVAGGHLRRVAGGLFDLFAVVLRLDELITHKRGRLCPRAGEAAAAGTDRVGAVGELDAAHILAGVVEYQKVIDLYGVVAELDIKRLSAVEMAGTGHDVDGREAAALRPLDARRTDIEAVEQPDVGLDRRRTVSA